MGLGKVVRNTAFGFGIGALGLGLGGCKGPHADRDNAVAKGGFDALTLLGTTREAKILGLVGSAMAGHELNKSAAREGNPIYSVNSSKRIRMEITDLDRHKRVLVYNGIDFPLNNWLIDAANDGRYPKKGYKLSWYVDGVCEMNTTFKKEVSDNGWYFTQDGRRFLESPIKNQ